MNGKVLRILTVCTGNASRSPAVERILAARLGPTVSVRSAGTAAAVGEPVAAEMAALLRQEGLDVDGFTARQVTPTMLRDADLVLPLARENLDYLVDLVPDVAERTFTLTDFARIVATTPPGDIVGDTPADRLRALVAAAAHAKGDASPSDDVPNPYRHGQAAYARAFAMIKEASATIVEAVRPGAAPATESRAVPALSPAAPPARR